MPQKQPQAEFNKYPNPTSGLKEVKAVGYINPDIPSVKVFAIHGEKILMKELSPGERKQEFFLTGKPTRIIVVQIIGCELSMSHQLVVYVGTTVCACREHVGSTMILNRT